MGTNDRGPFASSSDVRALCSRCGKTWPSETLSCPACGAELGGETVFDDGHAVEMAIVRAHGLSANTSGADTTPHGKAIASELPSFAERTDEEIEPETAVTPRKPSVADSSAKFGSSTDPPTRFLRGVDQHIELPGGSVVDDYEIDARLGAGAMGVVYSASHVKLGRRVAIKVIAPTMGEDPQALARFEREAKALASLHHPNIVDVSAFGTLPDQRSYFVMEYLVGETLEERLARGRVPLDEALDLLDQIARGLEAAHAQRIVHRDLKPSNTFLVQIPREHRSVVKLLDFGLAKLAVPDGVEKTASGAVIGTALYLSPEQARSPNVDGRTDVYALGCIAYELVLGRHPFPEARTPTAALAAHLTEPAPQPRSIWPGIPAALDLLLFSMLAKDPNYRPTLAQVRNVIASVRSPTTTSGRELRAATEAATHNALPSRVWIAALVAVALLLGIVIGAKVLGGTSSHESEPQISPVEGGATPPSGASEAPALLQPAPATAVVTPIPVLDAGVGPVRAPVADPPKPKRPKPAVAPPIDAAVSAAPDVPEPKEHPMEPNPYTPKPQAPDKNQTVNPFHKKPTPP